MSESEFRELYRWADQMANEGSRPALLVTRLFKEYERVLNEKNTVVAENWRLLIKSTEL